MAFNLVNHPILLHHLKHCLGISVIAYDWFQPCLSDCSQCVAISNVKSWASTLTCGVPRGSVLGPILFTIYTLPLGDIIHSHHTGFHLYADDSQLYPACDNSESSSIKVALTKLETCIDDIRQWMPNNHLKLNDNKTEFLFICSKFGTHPTNPKITIGLDEIAPASTARNIGVVFDELLIPFLLLSLVNIINLSLVSSTVPTSFNTAQLLSILKKPHLDTDELNNYSPISNLPFISRVLEQVVTSQLVTHLWKHNLTEPFQSAYRKNHSTETAVTFVNN